MIRNGKSSKPPRARYRRGGCKSSLPVVCARPWTIGEGRRPFGHNRLPRRCSRPMLTLCGGVIIRPDAMQRRRGLSETRPIQRPSKHAETAVCSPKPSIPGDKVRFERFGIHASTVRCGFEAHQIHLYLLILIPSVFHRVVVCGRCELTPTMMSVSYLTFAFYRSSSGSGGTATATPPSISQTRQVCERG